MHVRLLPPCMFLFMKTSRRKTKPSRSIDSTSVRWLKQVTYLSSSPCRRRQPRHGCRRGLACRPPWYIWLSLLRHSTPPLLLPYVCPRPQLQKQWNVCSVVALVSAWLARDRPPRWWQDTSRTCVCAPMAVPAGQWSGEGIGAEETIYRQGAPARERSSATLSIDGNEVMNEAWGSK